jgi:hypothetical protein
VPARKSAKKERILFYTENGLMIDLDELRKVVDNCDVFTIGFRLFPERLIVDSRSNDQDGPVTEVVEPVNTVEERFFWLGQRRPSFGVPQRFTFFVWPHSIRYMTESGLGDMIRRRLTEVHPDAAAAVDASLTHLQQLEDKAVRDAITGRNYHTVWQRVEPRA